MRSSVLTLHPQGASTDSAATCAAILANPLVQSDVMNKPQRACSLPCPLHRSLDTAGCVPPCTHARWKPEPAQRRSSLLAAVAVCAPAGQAAGHRLHPRSKTLSMPAQLTPSRIKSGRKAGEGAAACFLTRQNCKASRLQPCAPLQRRPMPGLCRSWLGLGLKLRQKPASHSGVSNAPGGIGVTVADVSAVRRCAGHAGAQHAGCAAQAPALHAAHSAHVRLPPQPPGAAAGLQGRQQAGPPQPANRTDRPCAGWQRFACCMPCCQTASQSVGSCQTACAAASKGSALRSGCSIRQAPHAAAAVGLV